MTSIKLMVPLALCVAVLVLGMTDARRKDRALRRMARDNAGCQYIRSGDWSECGPGVAQRQRVLQLQPGSPDECPDTRVITKPCRRGRNKMRKLKKNGKMKGCKYGRKSDWTECGPGVTTRQRVRQLKAGSPDYCPESRVITKPCRSRDSKKKNRRKKLKKKGRGKACKYTKGPWQPCNKITNVKKRELTLRKGDPSICSAVRTIEKPCRRRAAFVGAKTSQCRYQAQPWGECSNRTNTMTRLLTLKSGDPALCRQTKQLTRKCRKPCKFSKGEWMECDPLTGLKKRTDHLRKGDSSMCEATRVISKMCGKEEKCRYEVGNWSDCDQVNQVRTRVKTLISGDPEKCDPVKTNERPCLKPNGEEGCFLGKWGEYGPCQNGVMMKHRPVIAGGMECERKAVKAKPCP